MKMPAGARLALMILAALTLGCAAIFGLTAPEFPSGLDWLNTPRPLTMAELRGKVVLLDFWTYGCINCFHILPDLQKLEKEYPDELVIIGVHSAKYANEGLTDNIRRVILRYGITHPVVNDNGYAVWDAWGAEAWPTVAVVDPAGTVTTVRAGEGAYAAFKPVIQGLVKDFDARRLLDRRPLAARPRPEKAPDTVLSFPGKVITDAAGRRLFIADSSHNRIVIADAASGNVLDVAGGGGAGLRDGAFADALFAYPQGMALTPDGRTLYVADTGNNAIRALDIPTRRVATFAGTALASPWDLALAGDRLFIAMAGSHQVWVTDLAGKLVKSFAGTGAEGTEDGPREGATLAQPSGLAYDGAGRLYIASSEGNAIRWVDTDPAGGAVHTLAGSTDNLFDFGDRDGEAKAARFQHPLGVAFSGGALYVADTYNSRIRRIDLSAGSVSTIAGKGRGWRDGPDPLFNEPGGIFAAPDGSLLVADTNNHSVRVLDTVWGTARTVVLKGIQGFSSPAAEGSSGIKTLTLTQAAVRPGKAVIRLQLGLPDGYKLNPEAPFSMQWSGAGSLRLGADASRSVVNPALPLDIPVTAGPGSGMLTGTLSIVYCRTDEQGVCLLDRVRLVIPYAVAPGGQAVIPVFYSVEVPR
jgi:DNA-binding beta-propeller fold protein YncE